MRFKALVLLGNPGWVSQLKLSLARGQSLAAAGRLKLSEQRGGHYHRVDAPILFHKDGLHLGLGAHRAESVLVLPRGNLDGVMVCSPICC